MAIEQVKRRLDALSSMSELKPEEFCEEGGLADELAQELGEGLKSTQLRKVFHEFRNIERDVSRLKEEDKDKEFDRHRIAKLMPVIAYTVGRGLIPKGFYEILKTCLSRDRLKTNQDFLRAAEFITAVLAFHKFRHG